MLKTIIKKLNGDYLDHSNFETEQAGLEWFQSRIDKGVYGQKHVPAQYQDVEVSPAVLDEQGEVITPAVIEQVLVSEEIPAAFVIEHAEIVASEEELRQAKITRGAIDRAKCQNVLDLIAGYNRDRALTIPQITQMQQTFAQAEGLLRASRPDFAKQVIEAIEPDGVLVTEQMKDDCLALLGE